VSAREDGPFQHRIQRIEVLVQEMEALQDPVARAGAVELVQAVLELHGVGLGRLLETIQQAGAPGAAILERLTQDDLIGSLLLLHGLHPLGLEARVRQAVESLRPHLGVQGARVDLLDLMDDGLVRLRVEITGHTTSLVAVQQLAEDAVNAAAPEVAEVVFESSVAGQTGSFIPISAVLGVGSRSPNAEASLASRSPLPPGESAGLPTFDPVGEGEISLKSRVAPLSRAQGEGLGVRASSPDGPYA
jgi:hypothetical protein